MASKLIALAATVMVSATLATAAEAGGGVRLNFGGPLGTFNATPAHGGGAANHRAAGHQKPVKRKPVIEARRPKAEKPARVAKAPAPTKVEISKPTPVTVNPTDTASEATPPTTGSSALIQGQIPADAAPDAAAEPSAAESAPAQSSPPAQASAPAPSPTVTAATDTTPDENGCKKFVPAVGMTVSVGCGE